MEGSQRRLAIMELRNKISADIVDLLCGSELSQKERAVINILFSVWGSHRLKQRDIASHKLWAQACPNSVSNEERTVTREVRRTIRSLRVKHGIPILHDKDGHFLPEDEYQVERFIRRLELEAKKRAAASMETYKVMKDAVGFKSNLFEQLDSIGDQIVRQYS